MEKRRGRSYEKRLMEVNAIYDRYARSGLSNREIWRRYVYPRYGICERTFYNLIGRDPDAYVSKAADSRQYFLFSEADIASGRHSSVNRGLTLWSADYCATAR